MELLAPVGEIGSLEASINAGADCVYFGVPKFNARLSKEINHLDIKSVVDYCHLRGVKAYLTLNTLIKKDEMSQAIELARQAYLANINAIIVQDFNLVKELKREIPQLVLHASTQAGVHNLYGALTARDMGFNRVILARETLLNDIRLIKESGLEVEVFVHGANCISFSGNCYFSAVASGCSGNRGRCKQLCRGKYQAILPNFKPSTQTILNEKCVGEGFLLSPRDNCLLDQLRVLQDAGVDCLKIEGRYKRTSYIAGVTDVYRRAIDGLKNGDSGSSKADISTLKALFNRGDFFKGQHITSNGIIESRVSTHLGVSFGTVKSVTNNVFTCSRPLKKGDGLKFLRNGIEVGHAEVQNPSLLTFVGDVRAGDEIRVTTSAELEKKTFPQKRLGIELGYSIFNHILHASLLYNGVVVEAELEGSEALNVPTYQEDILSCFSKTDELPFYIAGCNGKIDSLTFFVKSKLNAFRRELFLRLADGILAVPAERSERIFTLKPFSEECFASFNTFVEVDEHSEYCAKAGEVLVFSPRQYGKLPSNAKDMLLDLPIFATSAELSVLESMVPSFMGVVANNLYGVELAKRVGSPLIAGFGLNCLSGSVFGAYFASLECSSREVGEGVVYAYGNLPIMTFRHCPSKTVGLSCDSCPHELYYKDKFGSFKIVSSKIITCTNTMYNSLPLDNLDSVFGKRFIDVRGCSLQESERILECARERKNVGNNRTRGLYKNGVV